MRKAMWILWPSFVIGGVAEVAFFTVIDPQELYLLGEPVSMGRMATYSIGFLLFGPASARSSSPRPTCARRSRAGRSARACASRPRTSTTSPST